VTEVLDGERDYIPLTK